MWCWFCPIRLFASHQGKSDWICISACTNTDMQEVLKDTYINCIIVITLFCNAPSYLFQIFQPITRHSPLLRFLFQFEIFLKMDLFMRKHCFHAYLAHTDSLIRQLFKQKRTVIYCLLYQLQWTSPVNNAPGWVQVPKPQNPLKEDKL